MGNTRIVGKITATERMASSPQANPRFMITIMTTEGEAVAHATSPNAGFAYGIENREYREQDHEYVINYRGNISYVNPYPARNDY
jgi:hypothetical protein